MNRESADCVVIGAGVVGLAVARQLARAGREVLVVESNPRIGMETSSRNSEVVHAGLYYPPGSIKAQTCVRGRSLLYDFCERKGVPYQRTGKLVVARDSSQSRALQRIRVNAAACGVDDLQSIDARRLSELEPEVSGTAALWSPSTGIVDSHALMLALQGDLEAAGGTVACRSPVTAGRVSSSAIELTIGTEDDLSVTTRTLINTAGLGAAKVAKDIHGIPAATIPAIHFARGHYFGYACRSPFTHLVYPLPEHGGLGVHGTLDLAGQLRFGPDMEYVERIDYAFDDTRRPRFAAAIRKWFPALDEDHLLPGYVGVRPRLAAPGEGFRDFIVAGPETHGIPGLVNLFGIESPGLTACLALAERVANLT